MIRNTRQTWEVGEIVRVGFMTLRVVAKIPTPGDYRPDVYRLCGLGQHAARQYDFCPHHGLTRLAAPTDHH